MKHTRLQLILLICSCLVLLPCAPVNVQAQDKAEDGKKVFDNYSTVVGMVYPAGGAMFKATGEMLDLFGYFGKDADPVGEAIRRINERLDILEKRVSGLETKVRAIENGLFRTQNMTRVRLLRSKQDALKLLAYKLKQKPTEKRDKLALAKEAEIIASRFLDDPDLWNWSDMREKDGVMLPPDFKPLPALEYYVVALVTWIAAIENAADGDVEFVKQEYGPELQKHITYLSVPLGWKDTDAPETLPENITVRVKCSLELLHSSPNAITRKCTIHEGCEDQIARVLSTVAIHEEIMPQGTEICNVPFSAKKMASEDELERMYGMEVMEKLAEKLMRLKDDGTVREQFIGTFGTTPRNYQPLWVYAIKNDGDLLWYRKDTGASNWQGPKRVGGGWSFKDVIPAGGNSIYALTDDGKLLWYRHDGFNDGSVNWKGPVNVGRGWTFTKIFSGGDGIVYAIKEDGTLLWYRQGDYLDAGGPERWTGPKAVGSGWQDFKDIFSSGEGKVYVIKPDGTLLLYQQIGWQSGERSWEAARQVGTGWANFRQIVPAGGGVILAIKDDGKLLWYKHLGLRLPVAFARARDAKETWEGPVQIGSGWQGFKKVFAFIPVTSAQIVR